MAKYDNFDDKRREKDLEEHKEQRTQTFCLCPKHNQRYPRGEQCPTCEAERDAKRR